MDSLTDPPHTACSATTSAPHPEALPSLAGLSREAIKDHIGNLGIPAKQLAMRTQQVWNWIYHHGVDDFAAMANVSKAIKQALAQNFTLERPEIIEDACSKDGTRKWLLRFTPGAEAETVFIPGVARSTALCVSSQVGCTLNCRFCYTGTQKLVRNLSAQEIVSQLLIARDRLQTWPSGQATNTPSNIVFMGMGEPLYNLDSVLEAIETLTDSAGLCTGQRHITVSTAGIAPQIPELGARSNALLAISLHATHDDLRNQLVPINRKYDLKTLFEAIRAYPGLSNARRVTFEYVMLDQVNDSDAEARDLLRLIAGIPAKINLIPFNPWPGSPYKCSKPERIRAFADIIWRGGYASPVRTPRGRDIMAACGQLRSASEKARRSKTSILPQIAHGDS